MTFSWNISSRWIWWCSRKPWILIGRYPARMEQWVLQTRWHLQKMSFATRTRWDRCHNFGNVIFNKSIVNLSSYTSCMCASLEIAGIRNLQKCLQLHRQFEAFWISVYCMFISSFKLWETAQTKNLIKLTLPKVTLMPPIPRASSNFFLTGVPLLIWMMTTNFIIHSLTKK